MSVLQIPLQLWLGCDSRRAGVGMKSAHSSARSDNSIQRYFAKKKLFSSKMAELIVRVHETVASYIANAEDTL